MKKVISALALATALFAGAANAADLPSMKAPPAYMPPPPVMSWNGFYAGLNVGGAWYDRSGAGGVIGGGQIGYNLQLTPMFVAGIEADFQGTSVRGLNWLGTVRGRLGATLFNPNLLVYGTGGFAYGEFQSPAINLFPGLTVGSVSSVFTGWTAGGGVEWMFMPNWSVKAEYLYTRVDGSFNVGFLGLPLNVPVNSNSHMVRAGVNYHFNLFNSVPVLAKY